MVKLNVEILKNSQSVDLDTKSLLEEAFDDASLSDIHGGQMDGRQKDCDALCYPSEMGGGSGCSLS